MHVYKNGFLRVPIRLYEVTKNCGKFHILVFAGLAPATRPELQKLRRQVDGLAGPYDHVLAMRTIVAGTGAAFAEHLGIHSQFGDGYWDIDQRAHEHYKIPVEVGALVVLRPDGMQGFVAPLDGFDNVLEYLSKIAIPREAKVAIDGANGHVGEMIVVGENNLYYQQAKEQGGSVEEGHIASG